MNTKNHSNRNDASNRNNTTNSSDIHEQVSLLFAQLNPQHVEQFYQGYQQWQAQRNIKFLQTQLSLLDQQIENNAVLMQLVQPSPIALAVLTRLQSYNVDDVDLLDTMLERGDTWLDHALQLLEHCERLGLLDDNYTQWCRHALEGAYDWIDSISEVDTSTMQKQAADVESQSIVDSTEDVLLQKLTSDDETLKLPTIHATHTNEMPLSIPTILSYPSTAQLAIPSILSYLPTMPIEVSERSMETTTPSLDGAEAKAIDAATVLSHEEAEAIDPVTTLPHEEHGVHIVPTPSSISPEPRRYKSSKRGVISRILTKVWQT